MSLFERANLVLLVAAVAVAGVSGCSSLAQMATGGGGSESSGGGGGDSSGAAVAKGPEADPNPEIVDKMLSCIPDLKPQDVQYGKVTEYEFTEGMNTDTRKGFIEREPVEMTNGCYLGELEPTDCVSLTVDTEKYAELGNSNKWDVQCVYAHEPSAGVIGNRTAMYPIVMDRLKPQWMVLMCNNNVEGDYECAEGNNSKRGGIWRDKLKAEGKTQLGFCVNENVAYQETPYEDTDYPGGRYLYCQYYNKTTKKSAVAWQHRVVANNL